MRKSRKNRSNLKMFFHFICVVFYFLIYTYLYLRIIHIGYRIAKIKEEYEHLSLLNKNYNLEFARLITPENLEKIATSRDIKLTIPKDWCFLKIEEKNENSISETFILEAGTR